MQCASHAPACRHGLYDLLTCSVACACEGRKPPQSSHHRLSSPPRPRSADFFPRFHNSHRGACQVRHWPSTVGELLIPILFLSLLALIQIAEPVTESAFLLRLVLTIIVNFVCVVVSSSSGQWH